MKGIEALHDMSIDTVMPTAHAINVYNAICLVLLIN